MNGVSVQYDWCRVMQKCICVASLSKWKLQYHVWIWHRPTRERVSSWCPSMSEYRLKKRDGYCVLIWSTVDITTGLGWDCSKPLGQNILPLQISFQFHLVHFHWREDWARQGRHTATGCRLNSSISRFCCQHCMLYGTWDICCQNSLRTRKDTFYTTTTGKIHLSGTEEEYIFCTANLKKRASFITCCGKQHDKERPEPVARITLLYI